MLDTFISFFRDVSGCSVINQLNKKCRRVKSFINKSIVEKNEWNVFITTATNKTKHTNNSTMYTFHSTMLISMSILTNLTIKSSKAWLACTDVGVASYCTLTTIKTRCHRTWIDCNMKWVQSDRNTNKMCKRNDRDYSKSWVFNLKTKSLGPHGWEGTRK